MAAMTAERRVGSASMASSKAMAVCAELMAWPVSPEEAN
jgi:hypothetical protein